MKERILRTWRLMPLWAKVADVTLVGLALYGLARLVVS